MALKHSAAVIFTLLFTMPELCSTPAPEARISERSERIDARRIPEIEDLFLEHTQHTRF